MAPGPSSGAKRRTLAQLHRQAHQRHLTITAGLDAAQCALRDDLPPGTQSLILLSPDEPAFWPAFAASAEYTDTLPDPIDRWSLRVISGWAQDIGATPLFPFGGPPFQPFLGWALASGHAHSSPIGMLVHARSGLYVSFRGALALPWAIDLPPPAPNPCTTCQDRPCTSACPVQAFGPAGYDTAACKTYLKETAGNDCMSAGCRARRACPIGKAYGRLHVHSSFHMSYFL